MTYERPQVLGDFFSASRKKGASGLPTLSVTMHDGLVIRDSLEKRTETNIAPEDHLHVREGDIAYNMMRVWQGALGRAEMEGIVSPAYVVLRPKSAIDTRYAEYLFKTPRMIYLFWAYSYGLTKDRLRLYFDDFKKIPVEIPEHSKQRRIAQILATWDAAISVSEGLVENCKLEKKALEQKLLTGKERLPYFKAEWEERVFGKLFEERVESGREDLPLLSITSDDGVALQDETGRKDNSNSDKSKYKRICINDIGYNTMRMWQGRSSLSVREGIISPAYTVLIPKSEIDPVFASYLFKLPSLVHVFFRHSQGLVSDTWNLKFSHFKKIKWKIPSIEEQTKIGRILLRADVNIKVLEKMLECLKLEKKALTQKLLVRAKSNSL